jgi:hypothetical protein
MGVAVADFNNAGKLDVVVQSNNSNLCLLTGIAGWVSVLKRTALVRLEAVEWCPMIPGLVPVQRCVD